MKKLRSLILTMCFMIVVSSSNIYATDRAIDYETTTSGTSSPPTASGKTELDGKIGEWDPNDPEKPNFDDYDDDQSNIEGTIPGSDKYFTISATVPLQMDFLVYPHSQASALGMFISPEYKIKNNGTKTISVKVKEIGQTTGSQLFAKSDLLYIGEKIPNDGQTQIELVLTAIDGQTRKDIDLYRLGELQNEEDKKLFTLGTNEEKKIQLNSIDWELPNFEVGKDEVKSDFNMTLEFSVVTPSTVTP